MPGHARKWLDGLVHLRSYRPTSLSSEANVVGSLHLQLAYYRGHVVLSSFAFMAWVAPWRSKSSSECVRDQPSVVDLCLTALHLRQIDSKVICYACTGMLLSTRVHLHARLSGEERDHPLVVDLCHYLQLGLRFAHSLVCSWHGTFALTEVR